jgi:hypothetical protein
MTYPLFDNQSEKGSPSLVWQQGKNIGFYNPLRRNDREDFFLSSFVIENSCEI